MILSNQTLPPSFEPTTLEFNLTQRIGSQANFALFDQFRLYETRTNLLLATAEYPSSVSLTPEVAKLVNDSVIRYGTGQNKANSLYSNTFPILATLFMLVN
jgi:hypothetical protein